MCDMRTFLTAFSALFFSVTAFSQTFGWVKPIEGSGVSHIPDSTLYGYPSHCQTDVRGNFYIAKGEYILKYAPAGNLLWSKRNAQWITSLKVDTAGNIYCIGKFSEFQDFDPGPGVQILSPGSDDAFLTKWTSDGDFVWAKKVGGPDPDEGLDLALDAAGNIYFTGSFRGTADFDPGPGVANLSATGTNTDIFVAKWDNAGNFGWAKKISGAGNDFGSSVLTDDSGYVYVGGFFSGTADFDPGSGTVNLNATNGSCFILKWDSNGNYRWARNAVGTYGPYTVPSLQMDPGGNLYLVNALSSTNTFNPGTGPQTLNSAGGYDGCISKYGNAGNFLWARRIGGTGNDYFAGSYMGPDGSLYLTGQFNATADMNPGTGVFLLSAQGTESDAFVLKLKPDNSFDWARPITSTKRAQGTSVVALSDGRVKTVGEFLGTADFDPGSGIYALSCSVWGNVFVSTLDSAGNFVAAEKISERSSFNRVQSLVHDTAGNIYSTGFFQGILGMGGTDSISAVTSAGLRDIFVSKRDSAGRMLWTRRFGGINQDEGEALAIDSVGNVYVTGYFNEVVDFQTETGPVSLTAAGGNDIFILKLNPNGNLLWAKRVGGINTDRGFGLTVDPQGNVYSTGYFSHTVDFDPGPGTFPITVNTPSVYILKLDTDGNFAWVKSLRGGYGKDITLDASGNIYTTGHSLGMDMDPGPGTVNVTGTGGDDVFISKLDRDGNYVWGKFVGGIFNDRGFSIRIDGQNNVYVAGNFQYEADFDPDTSRYILPGTTYEAYHAFLLKLDVDGKFVWAGKPGGVYPEYANVMSLDVAGNVYSTGIFEGHTDFDPGTGSYYLDAVGGTDIFVSKLNTDGNRVWTFPIGNAYTDEGQAVSVTRSGTVYLAGNYSGEVDFDPGTGVWPEKSPLQFDGKNVQNLFYLRLGQDLCSDMALRVDSAGNLSCAGPGYAGVHAVGGNSPYAYVWETQPPVNLPQIHMTEAGTYPLTVTDAMGCTRNLSLLIDGPQTVAGFDLDVTLTATSFRPGFTARIWPEVSNDGCVPTSGVFKLALDPYLTFLDAVPAPSAQTGDTLFWNIDSLQYGTENFAPEVNVRLSDLAPMGNNLHLHALALPVSGDADSSNNVKEFVFPIINGYDPNDKQVYPKGECIPGYVPRDQLLTYTVRFQNTGNADAINIYILDSLPPELDFSSVRVIRSSHPMYTEVLPGKKLKFVFDAIHLPDSTTDEPGSHGHVVFEVRPLANMPEGTELRNSAAIYFDYNPPVITNEVLNTLSDGTYGVSHTEAKSVCGSYSFNGLTYNQSGEYRLNLSTADGCDSTVTLHLLIGETAAVSLTETACDHYLYNGQTYTQSGEYEHVFSGINGCDSTVTLRLTINNVDASATQTGFTLTANAGGATYQWIDCENASPLSGFVSQSFSPQTEGNYAVRVTQNGCTDTSACFFVAGMGVGDTEPVSFLSLYPNPGTGIFTVNTLAAHGTLTVTDLLGKTVYQTFLRPDTGQYSIDLTALPKGNYTFRVMMDGKLYVRQVILY